MHEMQLLPNAVEDDVVIVIVVLSLMLLHDVLFVLAYCSREPQYAV